MESDLIMNNYNYILHIDAIDRNNLIITVKYHEGCTFAIKNGKIKLDGLSENAIVCKIIESLNKDEIIKSSSFDIIICNDLFNVYQNFSDLLFQLNNLLKPDGYLIFTHSDISDIICCINFFLNHLPEVLQEKYILKDLKTYHISELCNEFYSCGYNITEINRIKMEDDKQQIDSNYSSLYPDLNNFLKIFQTSIKYYIITVYPVNLPKKTNYRPLNIDTHFLQILEKSKLDLRYAFAHLLENYQKIECELNQIKQSLKNTEDKLKNTYFSVRFSQKVIAFLENKTPNCYVQQKVIDAILDIENLYYNQGYIGLLSHFKAKINRMLK